MHSEFTLKETWRWLWRNVRCSRFGRGLRESEPGTPAV